MKKLNEKISMRPTFLEINLSDVKHNLNQVRKITKNKKVMCIVKGNAYGHGLVEMSKFFESLNVDYLGVAIPEEGVEIRKSGIKTPILVLSAIVDEQIPLCIKNNLTITASSDEKLYSIEECAKKLNKKAKVHLKIDTGMGRIGVNHKRVYKFFEPLRTCQNCIVEGLYSHFACSDENNKINELQKNNFRNVISKFEKEGFQFPFIHMSNSGGILFHPDAHFTMTRVGIILYGYFKSNLLKSKTNFKKTTFWKTKVTYFKYVEKNTGIGYGHTYTTKQNTRIITLPVGYADGYKRGMSKKAKIIFKNKLYPVVGSICMDQIMVDIGPNTSAYSSDEVTLVGKSKNCEITFYDLAKWNNTSVHEVLCQISYRVFRKYI